MELANQQVIIHLQTELWNVWSGKSLDQYL